MNDIQEKPNYLAPVVKVVRFHIERGYSASNVEFVATQEELLNMEAQQYLYNKYNRCSTEGWFGTSPASLPGEGDGFFGPANPDGYFNY